MGHPDGNKSFPGRCWFFCPLSSGGHTSHLLTCAPQWEMFTILTRMAQRQAQSLQGLRVSPLDILRTYFQKLLDSVG